MSLAQSLTLPLSHFALSQNLRGKKFSHLWGTKLGMKPPARANWKPKKNSCFSDRRFLTIHLQLLFGDFLCNLNCAVRFVRLFVANLPRKESFVILGWGRAKWLRALTWDCDWNHFHFIPDHSHNRPFFGEWFFLSTEMNCFSLWRCLGLFTHFIPWEILMPFWWENGMEKQFSANWPHENIKAIWRNVTHNKQVYFPSTSVQTDAPVETVSNVNLFTKLVAHLWASRARTPRPLLESFAALRPHNAAFVPCDKMHTQCAEVLSNIHSKLVTQYVFTKTQRTKVALKFPRTISKKGLLKNTPLAHHQVVLLKQTFPIAKQKQKVAHVGLSEEEMICKTTGLSSDVPILLSTRVTVLGTSYYSFAETSLWASCLSNKQDNKLWANQLLIHKRSWVLLRGSTMVQRIRTSTCVFSHQVRFRIVRWQIAFWVDVWGSEWKHGNYSTALFTVVAKKN